MKEKDAIECIVTFAKDLGSLGIDSVVEVLRHRFFGNEPNEMSALAGQVYASAQHILEFIVDNGIDSWATIENILSNDRHYPFPQCRAMIAEKLSDNGYQMTDIAYAMGVNRTTLHHALKDWRNGLGKPYPEIKSSNDCMLREIYDDFSYYFDSAKKQIYDGTMLG